jgi:hypothetical protein
LKPITSFALTLVVRTVNVAEVAVVAVCWSTTPVVVRSVASHAYPVGAVDIEESTIVPPVLHAEVEVHVPATAPPATVTPVVHDPVVPTGCVPAETYAPAVATLFAPGSVGAAPNATPLLVNATIAGIAELAQQAPELT